MTSNVESPAAPPGRLEQRKARTRSAIQDAATRLFTERGYVETAMHDVAREANVGVGTLYGYFASKEDLLRAVLRLRWRGAIEDVQRAVDRSAPQIDQAVSIVLELARYIRGDRSLLTAAFTLKPQHRSEEDDVFAGKMLSEFAAFIERGIAAGAFATVPPRATVNVLVSSTILAMLHLPPWEEQADDDAIVADLERITRALLRP